jgi:hypothetical protein
MANENTSSLNEKFSDDPEENLRIENDILRLKIQAQFGGFSAGTDIPPEQENEFLKNVLAFEEQYANAKRIKLYEVIGSPAFLKEDILDDEAISCELDRLQQLMAEKWINVAFIRPRDDRFKYRFITEELFDHETEDVMVPGIMKGFIYEEFHPDHELDIRERSESFLTGWFEKNLSELEFWLAPQFIHPEGRTMSKDDLLEKFKKIFAIYADFEETDYGIEDISWELNNEDERIMALGFCEGWLKYTAVVTSGERKKIEAPFKIYFTCEYGWWNIFFFYLPGFNC